MEELRQEIQQIRDEMNHTIEAIQERVSPQHLMEQARDAVQEVTHGAAADVAKNARDTAATAGSAAWNTVREHPIPVALAGLGLGWLLTHRSAGTTDGTAGLGSTRTNRRSHGSSRNPCAGNRPADWIAGGNPGEPSRRGAAASATR